MKLRKQLLTSFLSVAILPLFVVGIYMTVTNLILAFDLHKQNLQNSAEIQVDLVEETINRLMVRAGQLASSRAVRLVCRDGLVLDEDLAQEFSNEILNFTDETVDNVLMFALVSPTGQFRYSSGSNGDNLALKENLAMMPNQETQYIFELPLSGPNCLIIYTPVKEGTEFVGSILTVCRTDYLLKMISSHRQLESSNALIYCSNHREVVTSKRDLSSTLPELERQMDGKEQGSLLCEMDGDQTLVYFRRLSKTRWVLVSTISTGQIFSQVWSYGLINLSAFLLVLLIIVFLSRRQSRRILHPMDQLLGAVESFFLAGAAEFPDTGIDPKSEVGYLAEKFTRLSDEVVQAQGKLQESNFLYEALLRATYEFRIVVDLQANSAECSSAILNKRIECATGRSAADRVLSLLTDEDPAAGQQAVLFRIMSGKLTAPVEAEAQFSAHEMEEKRWYRVVAVPVMQGSEVWRVVLHFEDITEQKREELRLIQSSQTDPLCGLLNKTAFPLYCKMSDCGKTDAMFFIDLDKFKQVNDTLGHTAGDKVLVSTAHAIRTQFRESDVVGRFGGDEFVVFAPGISQEVAEKKASRLLQAISFHLDAPHGVEIHVTASVGVCMATHPVTLEQAIQRADEAMYQAKERGPGQYCITLPQNEK